MGHYIYSTLAAGVDYTFYKDGPRLRPDSPETRKIKTRHITIKGGAGVATRRTNLSGEIVTPNGMVTKVDDEELSLLESHALFKQHVEAGYIKVEKKNVKTDKAIEYMQKRDVSAPKIPSDFKKAPKTGAE